MFSLVSLLMVGGTSLLRAEPDEEAEVVVSDDKLPFYAKWVSGPPILPLPEWTETDLAQVEAGPILLGGDLGIFSLDSEATTSEMALLEGFPADITAEEENKAAEFLDDSQRDLYLTVRPHAVADPFDQVPLKRLDNLSKMLRENVEPVGTAFHVMVLCRNQRFPMNTRWREQMDRWFGQDESAVIIAYPIGLPEEADLIYSERLSEALPLTKRLEISDRAMAVALSVEDRSDQLERYLLEICNGYYRYRETIQLPKLELPRVVTNEQPPEVKVARSPEFFSLWRKAQAGYAMLTFFVIASLAAIAIAVRQAYQKNINRQYVFPDRRIFPRFGGSCSGGAGSAVRFDKRLGS